MQFKLGRLTHYAFDLVLCTSLLRSAIRPRAYPSTVSAFLAGVKRSTGLTYALSSIHSTLNLYNSHTIPLEHKINS